MDGVETKVRQADGDLIVEISGDIDENSEFPDLPIDTVQRLVLDLDEVRMLNSAGLREWILWIRKIGSRVQVVFRNCPKAVVDQMNVLDGFVPLGAIVESFYVPYYCEDCDNELIRKVERGKDFMEGTADRKEGILIEQSIACPQCGESMELDVMSEKYFRFLKYRPR